MNLQPDIKNHPCFNVEARSTSGRIHLPVAPRCNIQCKYCVRKFDCVNENRPGVSSVLLDPHQALSYLGKMIERAPNIKVVGIAGPGDPFANPQETMETLRLVRASYPEMLLCVATNGLNIHPYIEELSILKTSHVTITMNAIDPAITQKIYSWFRVGKTVLQSEEGSPVLLKRQMEAIAQLKKNGIIVKINTLIIPGINDSHVVEVAKKAAMLGADIMNLIPYYNNPSSAFGHIPSPDHSMVHALRMEAGKHIKQMGHCARCRADAAGLIGENNTEEQNKLLSEASQKSSEPAPLRNKRVAVTSIEGLLIDQHLGEAEKILIYGKNPEGKIEFIESRETPVRGQGEERWKQLAMRLDDCGYLLVSGAGASPKKVMAETGITIAEVEGLIEDAVKAVYEGNLDRIVRRIPRKCGEACSGKGDGCS